MTAVESVTRSGVRIVRHGRLCLGLLINIRLLQALLNAHSFWARGRRQVDLVRMLLASAQVVTAWNNRDQLVGFGRATSDGVYRAVLWDVVVAEAFQGQGIGGELVKGLLTSDAIRNVERIYLMTTNSGGFYEKLGFKYCETQKLFMLASKAKPNN